jgi:magnesium chelatase subunit I
MLASAAEFVLEGLYAHKRIGRSEERTFTAGEKQPRREKPNLREEGDDPEFRPRQRRPFN